MKDPTEIAPQVLAGGQPSADDLKRLADMGVTTIVNLRREGEANQALSPQAEGEIARSLGMTYVHLPASINDLRADQVESFGAAVAGAGGKVFVHCGAGQRACAIALTHKALANGTSADAVFAEAEQKGVAFPDQPVRDFIGGMLKRG